MAKAKAKTAAKKKTAQPKPKTAAKPKEKIAKEKITDAVKAHNKSVAKPAVKTPMKKVCRTCKKTKQVKTKDGKTNFWKNARAKDGLRDQCKDCFYDYRKSLQDAEEKSETVDE